MLRAAKKLYVVKKESLKKNKSKKILGKWENLLLMSEKKNKCRAKNKEKLLS